MSSNMESAVVEVPLFSAFAVGFSQSSAGFMTSRHPRPQVQSRGRAHGFLILHSAAEADEALNVLGGAVPHAAASTIVGG